MQKNKEPIVFRKKTLNILAPILLPLIIIMILSYSLLLGEKNDNSFFDIILLITISTGVATYIFIEKYFKIIIDDNSLKKISIWGTSEIQLDAIENYNYSEKGIEIYRYKCNFPSITIPTSLKNQISLNQWFLQFEQHPELKKVQEKHEAEIKDFYGEKEFGFSSLEKEENLRKAILSIRAVTLLTYFLAFYFMLGFSFYPEYLLIDVVAYYFIFLPFILGYLVYTFKGMIKVDSNDDENPSIYPSIYPALIFVWFTNVFWVFLNWYIHEISEAIMYSSILAICITCLFVIKIEGLHIKKIKDLINPLFLLIGLFVYSYGAITYVNIKFDTSKEKVFTPTILSKKVNGDVTHITVTPWYSFSSPVEIEVPKYIYKKTKINSQIEINLKSGYLGIEWYIVKLKK